MSSASCFAGPSPAWCTRGRACDACVATPRSAQSRQAEETACDCDTSTCRGAEATGCRAAVPSVQGARGALLYRATSPSHTGRSWVMCQRRTWRRGAGATVERWGGVGVCMLALVGRLHRSRRVLPRLTLFQTIFKISLGAAQDRAPLPHGTSSPCMISRHSSSADQWSIFRQLSSPA